MSLEVPRGDGVPGHVPSAVIVGFDSSTLYPWRWQNIGFLRQEGGGSEEGL